MTVMPSDAAFIIREDDLTGPEIRAMLTAHLAHMAAITPEGSMHAFDIDKLRQPDVKFWSAWSRDGMLLGCGALKTLDARHGELKSMRTSPEHRGRGVAAAVLRHVMAEAGASGFTRLSLETGAGAEFSAAHRLYARHGFERTGPFGSYREDPNSVFMTRQLTA